MWNPPVHRTAKIVCQDHDRPGREQFNFKPERYIGDTAYGTAPMLVDGGGKRHRTACACVGQTERNNDRLAINDFRWIQKAEELLPDRQRIAQRMASLQERAFACHHVNAITS
jgi:2-polyprenyl-6-methoxyphenol hydroxylase-like FAD-dependent oxidoreductase